MPRQVGNWLDAYLEYTQNSEAPDAFHYWTGIATLAGALRRRVWIDEDIFKWYPNFFLCFVAPPGIVSKSTTVDIGMGLLREVEGINFGPNSITWQALVGAFGNAREDYPLPDGTYMPMSALTVVASELGSFLVPGDTQLVTLLTDLYDCKDYPFKKETLKDGVVEAVNCWLNFVGCTTPSWIAENWSSYFLGGGFAARTLFVFADTKRRLIAYPHLATGRRNGALREALVSDLRHVSQSLQGPFTLTEGAIRWGTEWYARHHSADNALRTDRRTETYFGRKPTHLHKTAMILSVARGDDMLITEQDLREADRAITALEPNMLSVFGEMNREAVTEHMALTLSIIRANGPLTKSACYRRLVTKMGYTTFDECLNGLLGAGLIAMSAGADGAVLRFTGQDVVARVSNVKGASH